MTRKVKSWLGTLLFLSFSLGPRATGQTPLQPAEIIGPYNCSAPGFTKQKLFFFSGNRWVKGPIFDPAAFKLRRVSVKAPSYRGRMLFLQQDAGVRGEFRVQKDRVILYPLGLGARLGLQGFLLMDVQVFRIDPTTGDLIEIRTLGSFRPPLTLLTCTRDGFF